MEIDDIIEYLREKSVEDILNEALMIESRYIILEGKEEFIGYRIYLPFGYGWYVDTSGGIGKDGEVTFLCCECEVDQIVYNDEEICKKLHSVEDMIRKDLLGGDVDGGS